MSNDDFWKSLARGHAASTYQSSVDLHLSGKTSREKFTSVREISDFGRQALALPLPVSAGTMVVFAGDLGATLSMENPPTKGMPGEVVSVKSASGDVTSHDGMVFVEWADGVFRSVHAEYLRPARLPKQASKREFVDSIKNRGRFPAFDADEYPPIQGMEGPFRYPSGRVLYYDPREGAYYDSKTDMYLDRNEKLASEESKSEDDPCWEGYEMFGMKDKDGKKVPNCIPQKKAYDSGMEKYNPYAQKMTFEQFKKSYFPDEPGIKNSIAKEFWDDFRFAFKGSLREYIKQTTGDWSYGNPRLARVRRFRTASLGDLSGFLKMADGTLIHKSTKDLWSFKKDADGGLTVERMFDADGKPLKA